MADANPGRLHIGSVLTRSVWILRRNLAPFTLLALILTVPSLLSNALPSPDGTVSAIFPFFLNGLIQLVLSSLLTAAITYRTIADLRGTQSDLPHALRQSGALILPVTVAALLIGLLISLGMILLIVPGFYVMTTLWVAIPAIVVERCRIIASLRRSAELTGGNRLRVFAIIAVYFALVIFVGWLIVAALGYTGLAAFVSYIVTAPIVAWGAVATAVIYHDLRLLTESGTGLSVR
jgi:hypothetical protein